MQKNDRPNDGAIGSYGNGWVPGSVLDRPISERLCT
ncbi:hypothetical protein M2243_002682 [Heliophilum fasciatum]|nr:hypothetical protein [Heliophilum fasciatum]